MDSDDSNQRIFRVYAFGSHQCCKLGSIYKQLAPLQEVYLGGAIIKNIACAKQHTLAPSNIGELFLWGRNASGELGLGDRFIRGSAEKIETGSEKVIDIAASFASQMSAILTEQQRIYVWGYVSAGLQLAPGDLRGCVGTPPRGDASFNGECPRFVQPHGRDDEDQ